MTISSHIYSPCRAVIEIGGVMIEMFGQKLTVQRFDDLRSDHGEIGTPAGSGKLVEKIVSDAVPRGIPPPRRCAGMPAGHAGRAAAYCAVVSGLHWGIMNREMGSPPARNAGRPLSRRGRLRRYCHSLAG
jgi:hypothetical protein